MHSTHEEVRTKVTAWVDRGVAPLVAALNELPDFQTLESCEGYGNEQAVVFFQGRGSRATALDTMHAARHLVSVLVDSQTEVAYEVEVRITSRSPEYAMATIELRPEDVGALTSAIIHGTAKPKEDQ